MLGHTHAVTGMATAAALLPVVPIEGAAGQLAWVAVASGWALAPDIDHPKAAATRMWGPVSYLAHRVIAVLARGHRAGTHDPILAPVLAAGLVLAAALHPLTAVLPVAVTIGLCLRALAWLIPGNHERHWVINLPVSLAGGWWLTTHTAGDTGWLAAAAALGVLVAIAGDALTPQGVVIPLSWLTRRPRRTPGGPGTTGGWIEPVFVLAAYVTTAVCLYLHVDVVHGWLRPLVDAITPVITEGL